MSPRVRALFKEWPLLLSYGSLIVVLIFGSSLFESIGGVFGFSILFFWLFLVILFAAFGVVHHAECLAHKLGEPYGTLILTLSVIGLEVLMIVTVMLTKSENPEMARDTMFGVLMIVVNGLFGAAIIFGALKHRIQQVNFRSTETYIGGIIVLVGIGLVLPTFVEAKNLFAFEVFLIGTCVAIYGLFLWIQTKEHRGFFISAPAEGEIHDHAHDSPFGVGYHVVFMILTLVPLVILAKQLSVVLDFGLEIFGLPDALAGLVVAVLILAPEGLAAFHAARVNNLQRALNICLGSALATIGLTIPAVLIISFIIGQEVTLGLAPVEIVLVAMSITLLTINLGKGETNLMKGALHLMLFATYCIFVFI
jgi:Ca2+:H+ antiporter